MSLNIEGTKLVAECLNHPNDVYIYFDGGFFVWNWNVSAPMGIWRDGDMFFLAKWKFHDGHHATNALNTWANERAAVAITPSLSCT